jgi:hypothetical protein
MSTVATDDRAAEAPINLNVDYSGYSM